MFIIFYYFIYIYFYFLKIFIHIPSKQLNMIKSSYSLLFVSGKKAILSYEWCACFDSDCHRKMHCACRPRSTFVSDGRLSIHSFISYLYNNNNNNNGYF